MNMSQDLCIILRYGVHVRMCSNKQLVHNESKWNQKETLGDLLHHIQIHQTGSGGWDRNIRIIQDVSTNAHTVIFNVALPIDFSDIEVEGLSIQD